MSMPSTPNVSASPWPVHPAADLFPMLGADELRELADDIREHGLLEPLWLWNDPERSVVLLDGRNRSAACRLAGVKPTTRIYRGDDPISFVISENVKRRHLTTGQLADIALRSEPLYAEQARAKEARRKVTPPHRQESPDTPADRQESESMDVEPKAKRESTAKAAKSTGTSGRSVARMKRIVDAAPDLAEKVRAGTMALDRAERVIRDRESERKLTEKAKRESAEHPPSLVDIRHGDFRTVLVDVANVDAIITDPPYPKEFLSLLADLAAWADKALKPDGVLAVLMGQTHLPEVYRLLDGGRPYRWTACYLTPGAGYASKARRLQSNWKPLLIYGGGPRFVDIVRAEGTGADARNNHKWGQDYGAFHSIVERLTERGQTVVDPFMGSGTTLLAAHALGRHAIGCDVDPEHVATAQARLS